MKEILKREEYFHDHWAASISVEDLKVDEYFEDGTFVSWDPLAHNPIINIYRRFTKSVRTPDEKPITINQLKLFSRYSEEIDTKGTWLFTLWIFIKFYLIDRVDPNKERYRKKIISEHRQLDNIYYKLEQFDNVIPKYFPFLKRYYWNIVVVCKNKRLLLRHNL